MVVYPTSHNVDVAVTDLYDVYLQRGLAYKQMKNFRQALPDLQFAIQHAPSVIESSGDAKVNVKALIHNYIGMSEAQLGDLDAAILSYEQAKTVDPTFKEAHLNYAQTIKETGRWKDALVAFDAALLVERLLNRPVFGAVHAHLGQLHYGLGNPVRSLFHWLLAIKYPVSPPDNDAAKQNLLYCALCYHSLGCFSMACHYYDRLLTVDDSHFCWYQKQVALYVWKNMNATVNSFNLDAEVHPYVKDGWVKKASWQHMISALYSGTCSSNANLGNLQTIYSDIKNNKIINARSKNVICISSIANINIDVISKDVLCVELNRLGENVKGFEPFSVPTLDSHRELQSVSADALDASRCVALIKMTCKLGQWLHLDSAGFLPNVRQQTMFGVAVVEMAQNILRLKICTPNSAMELIPNARSSKDYPIFVGSKDTHAFEWRDYFDVIVKWRQISEPNDAVWWIDRFPSQAFREGFGLQTPIVNGQLKTIRYYSYFRHAVCVLKAVLCSDLCFYSTTSTKKSITLAMAEHVQSLDTLQDIYTAIGEDFFVITSCYSVIPGCEGVFEEGTRLTLVSKFPAGFEFTIRTPGTPRRWLHFDKELNYTFSRIRDLVREFHVATSLFQDANDVSNERDVVVAQFRSKLLDAALELFFVWVNFSPLSRGTAACGYAGLLAAVVSIGYTFTNSVPAGKQLDWEAIFSPRSSDFIAKVRDWFEFTPLSLSCSSNVSVNGLENLNCSNVSEIASVCEVFPTMQSMLRGLSCVGLNNL